jgi:hypothetical protein
MESITGLSLLTVDDALSRTNCLPALLRQSQLTTLSASLACAQRLGLETRPGFRKVSQVSPKMGIQLRQPNH